MAKRSIGSLMRKKLSDITNSDSHKLVETLNTDNPCIQQLLQERTTFMQLIAERDEMIELNCAELRRLQADIKELQQQNWNLAQSNSFMLAELNSGRERIKILQHEISWRAALLKGKSSDTQERVDMDNEKNASLSHSQVPGLKEKRDDKTGQPSVKASSDEQQSNMNNRRRIRSKSIGSTTYSTSKDMAKDNRRRLRRHSVTFKSHEHEPLENLFEIEDAMTLNSSAVEDGTRRESSTSRKEAPRSSFGRPLRKAAEKVQTYKEIPVNVKMRRLE